MSDLRSSARRWLVGQIRDTLVAYYVQEGEFSEAADSILAGVEVTQETGLTIGPGVVVFVDGVPITGPASVPGRLVIRLPRGEPS